VKGDSLSFGLHSFVSQYSHIQFSNVSSSSQSQLSSSHQFPPHHQHGNATAVTIQFHHISATGEGRLIHTFCGHTHIAIHSCAVNVGAA
jgi:hypothetical protein